LVFIYFPELNLNQAEVKIVAEFLQKTPENAENRLKNIAGICTTRRGTHKSQKRHPEDAERSRIPCKHGAHPLAPRTNARRWRRRRRLLARWPGECSSQIHMYIIHFTNSFHIYRRAAHGSTRCPCRCWSTSLSSAHIMNSLYWLSC